ncbi:hypothetical protein BpHYR1_023312 [Brachionus plicatilis]|uniref:Uncharacterized protein n=1 Tax=Brachionus plicatilis TaxID=10195 RepID=A0A3M7PXS5_BRAPC|nr:hypothetical protein BpHYR1_023312 [Brachionus plicatilis]
MVSLFLKINIKSGGVDFKFLKLSWKTIVSVDSSSEVPKHILTFVRGSSYKTYLVRQLNEHDQIDQRLNMKNMEQQSLFELEVEINELYELMNDCLLCLDCECDNANKHLRTRDRIDR